MNLLSRIVMFLLAIAAVAGRAPACSMVEGYKVPTNLELAVKAERIVVAQIVSAKPSDTGSGGSLFLKPLVTIKGTPVEDTIELPGAMIGEDARLSRLVASSSPRELRDPNPGALIGACVRYIFARNMNLVLFLHRDESGHLAPFRSAFSRDAEDVPSIDSLWVKTVREYASISNLPAGNRKAAMKARVATLRAAGDADSLAMAEDFEVELKGKRLPPYD